jgi:hypothetical protein
VLSLTKILGSKLDLGFCREVNPFVLCAAEDATSMWNPIRDFLDFHSQKEFTGFELEKIR